MAESLWTSLAVWIFAAVLVICGVHPILTVVFCAFGWSVGGLLTNAFLDRRRA